VLNRKDGQFNFSFLTLLFSGIYLQFSGRLFVAELLFFVVFLSMVIKGSLQHYLFHSKLVIAINLLILALLGQIISDVHRNSEIQYFIKGSLLIFFTIVNLIVIAKIVDKKLNRYLVVVVLYSISSMTSYVIQPKIFEDASPWKFGFGYPITAIFFAAVTYKRQLKPQTILASSLLLVVVDFIFGARSLALITIFAGVMSFVSRKGQLEYLSKDESENFDKKVQSKTRHSTLGLFVLVMIVGSLVFFGYKSAVTKGLLGSEAELKFIQQTSTNTNLLFTSRSEVFSQFVAIRSSPIVGHGSYAPLTAEIREKLLPWLIENRLQSNLIQLESGIRYVIPVHSGIFGFWVWFGILSVPFFIYTFKLAFAVIRTKRSSPIIYYFAILICWDILFSPFGMYARMQYPITLIGMLLFSEMGKGMPNEKRSNR
jgi:hypothetical protein